MRIETILQGHKKAEFRKNDLNRVDGATWNPVTGCTHVSEAWFNAIWQRVMR